MSKASRGELSTTAQQTRSAPFPTRPGLARVASFLAQVGQARRALGEGSLLSPEASQPNSTLTPDPSPHGGGEPTASVATSRGISAGIRIAPAVAHNTGFSAALRHARYILSENAVTGFAFALFLAIVLAALVGPYLVPYDPLASDTAAALKAPSVAHWFGTDQLGRDVFSRVVVATRLDFFIAVASVALVFLMGGLAGVAAGFFGGWTDRVVGRIADTIMAFPLFVLAMGIVAALGNTVQNVVLATAIVNFPLYARIARAEANVRREAGFVQAARLSGNGELRILLAQILPNIMPIMVVQMSLTMGYAILNAAGLSFIGLGVRPPTAEWGIMVAEGAAFMVSGEWWIAFFPGAALMVAVFCFNLLGDGLRDIVDPQRRT
jgi:peptide/nickel transport system permease protein